jgi:hypothetical protein
LFFAGTYCGKSEEELPESLSDGEDVVGEAVLGSVFDPVPGAAVEPGVVWVPGMAGLIGLLVDPGVALGGAPPVSPPAASIWSSIGS